MLTGMSISEVSVPLRRGLSLGTAVLGSVGVTGAATVASSVRRPTGLLMPGQLLCCYGPGMIISDAPFTLKGFQAWTASHALPLFFSASCIPKSLAINTAQFGAEDTLPS